MSDNGSTVTKSRGAKGSIILILWHYTWNDDIDDVGVEGQVFYIQYYFLWERYFSVLSGSEGGDYLDTGSSSSSSSSSGGGDYLDTSSDSSGSSSSGCSKRFYSAEVVVG